jgi:hypothetical protein
MLTMSGLSSAMVGPGINASATTTADKIMFVRFLCFNEDGLDQDAEIIRPNRSAGVAGTGLRYARKRGLDTGMKILLLTQHADFTNFSHFIQL